MEVSNTVCVICYGQDDSKDYYVGSQLTHNANFKEFLNILEIEQIIDFSKLTLNKKNKCVVKKPFKSEKLLHSLDNCGVNLAVCGACMPFIEEAVETKGRVVEVEKQVLKLQKELTQRLKTLQDLMNEYSGRVKRVGVCIRDSDDGGSFLETCPISDSYDVMCFRRQIINVAISMGQFRDILDDKVSAPKRSHNNSDIDAMQFRDGMMVEVPPTTRRLTRKCKKLKVTKNEQVGTKSDDLVNVKTEPLPLDVHSDDHSDEMDFFPETNNGFGSDLELESDYNYSDATSDFELEGVKSKSKKSTKLRKGTVSKRGNIIKDTPPTSSGSKFRSELIATFLRRISFARSRKEDEILQIPTVESKFPICYDSSTGKVSVCDTEILINEDPETISCTSCEFKTAIPHNGPCALVELIYNHVAGVHYDAFQCAICPKKFKSKKKFKAHLRTHKDTDSCICDICGRPLGDKDTVTTHKWSHLSEAEKEEAHQSGNVPWHYRRRTPQGQTSEQFQCTICGKEFENRSSVRRHEETHEVDNVICPKCGKEMKRRSYVVYHQKYTCPAEEYQVANASRIKCLKCEETFKTMVVLKKHMKRVHSDAANERPFTCEACGRSYKVMADLKYHQKTHSLERPWVCDKCGADFNVKRNLTRHKCR